MIWADVYNPVGGKNLQDRREPSIQLDKEPAIAVGEPDPPLHLTPQDDQLMSERRNCGRGMRFYCVEPTDARGHEQRVFSCPECAQQKTILVKHE